MIEEFGELWLQGITTAIISFGIIFVFVLATSLFQAIADRIAEIWPKGAKVPSWVIVIALWIMTIFIPIFIGIVTNLILPSKGD